MGSTRTSAHVVVAAGRPSCDAGQNDASGTRIRVCWVLARLSQQMASSRSTAVTFMHGVWLCVCACAPERTQFRGATRSENTAGTTPFGYFCNHPGSSRATSPIRRRSICFDRSFPCWAQCEYQQASGIESSGASGQRPMRSIHPNALLDRGASKCGNTRWTGLRHFDTYLCLWPRRDGASCTHTWGSRGKTLKGRKENEAQGIDQCNQVYIQ